jgi:hypothetical protein
VDRTEQRSPAEVARAGYAAWNSGDLETFLETVHPDVLWVSSGVFPGLRSSYSGHAGMHEFWAAFMEPWEMLEIEVDLPFTNHLTIRDEKLCLFRSWGEWDKALVELGIEDPRGSSK